LVDVNKVRSLNVEPGRKGVTFSGFVKTHPHGCFCSKRSQLKNLNDAITTCQPIMITCQNQHGMSTQDVNIIELLGSHQSMPTRCLYVKNQIMLTFCCDAIKKVQNVLLSLPCSCSDNFIHIRTKNILSYVVNKWKRFGIVLAEIEVHFILV